MKATLDVRMKQVSIILTIIALVTTVEIPPGWGNETSISGQVLAKTGTLITLPLYMPEVYAENVDTGEQFNTSWMDPNGNYTIFVPEGKYQVGVFCTTPRKGALRKSIGQNHLRIEAVMPLVSITGFYNNRITHYSSSHSR